MVLKVLGGGFGLGGVVRLQGVRVRVGVGVAVRVGVRVVLPHHLQAGLSGAHTLHGFSGRGLAASRGGTAVGGETQR